MSGLPSSSRDITKKAELMQFLHEHVFDPVLNSPQASEQLKQGVRGTIMRMSNHDPAGMIQYFWSAITGTDRSTRFARQMRAEGFTRFEEVLEQFRERFNDAWLRS